MMSWHGRQLSRRVIIEDDEYLELDESEEDLETGSFGRDGAEDRHRMVGTRRYLGYEE